MVPTEDEDLRFFSSRLVCMPRSPTWLIVFILVSSDDQPRCAIVIGLTPLPHLCPRLTLRLVCLFLPQRLQRAAPGDDLVKHGVDRLLLLGRRLEEAEVLEVREE